MFSTSAPVTDQAAQLATPGSSVGVPPPAANTSEKVGLSPGSTIREDLGAAAAAATGAAAAASTYAGFKNIVLLE